MSKTEPNSSDLFQEGVIAGRIRERNKIKALELENERNARNSPGIGLHYLKIHLFDENNFYYGVLNNKSMIDTLLSDDIKISSDVVMDVGKIKGLLYDDISVKKNDDYRILINIDSGLIDTLKLEKAEKYKEKDEKDKIKDSIVILKKNIDIIIKALFKKNKNIRLNNSKLEIIKINYFDNKTKNNKLLYSRNKNIISSNRNNNNLIDYYWNNGEGNLGDFVRYIRDETNYNNFSPEPLNILDLNMGGLVFNIIVKIKVHKGDTKLKKEFINVFDNCNNKKIALKEQLAYHVGEFEKYLKPKYNKKSNKVKGGKKTYTKKKKRKVNKTQFKKKKRKHTKKYYYK